MTEAQKKILEVAGKMFFKFGIRSVSIDDISKELGMSKKTFYASFETKDDLVASLLDVAIEHTREKMWESFTSKPLQEAVACFASSPVQDNMDVRRVPQLVFDLQKYYPQQFEHYQLGLFQEQRAALCAYIRENQEKGLIRTDIDADLTSLMLAKMHADTIRDAARMEEDGINVGHFMHTAVYIIIRGVLTREGYELVFENSKTIE